MPRYHLNALGDANFESMVQALLKRVIGAGTLTFGAGRDGAREATYAGSAPYPSTTDRWDGRWIFQVKFHDTDLVGAAPARAKIVQELEEELRLITEKYKYQCDNYILITNVPLTPVHKSGNIDRIYDTIFPKYSGKIKQLAVWGADDVNGMLDAYPEVRTSYLPLLVSGDVIAELLRLVDQPQTDRAEAIDLYLRTVITREEPAQLDQAGDVSEEPIPLQQVFFDLAAYVPTIRDSAVARQRDKYGQIGIPIGENYRTRLVEYLANSNLDRVVIVGGPGEGKSTVGQYLAQLHRAALVGKINEMAIGPDYFPEMPRIPFRVALRDFAQWLAHRPETSESDGLDFYLSESVNRISGRSFTAKDLHEILRTNPTLLILDGLDEVTDTVVKRSLISRLSEFLDRCDNSLHADVQVIATTRPTGYSEQFDPRTFIHFHLHKLIEDQVRQYVVKWSKSRTLDEAKAERLRETIEECLADDQIKLLATTPLQVTILILIIISGGTPPRQREALFDEYLEVIYKREKAKGLGIVQTEKELLIGLHRRLAYLLQEEATVASTTSAALPRPEYEHLVHEFLRASDPFSPDAEIRKRLKEITIDAGERLVLIVESPANIFGFELRSIQEFFAACYLADIAKDTAERNARFLAIAPLPHWRNVALFFAGRIGRNLPGEAANIVETCREVDRSGADVFVRRGAELALELAADRALEPARTLQRSLLEHGLSLLDARLSHRTRIHVLEVLGRLAGEDIRDHVIPILGAKLQDATDSVSMDILFLLSRVAPNSEVLRTYLLQLASRADDASAASIVTALRGPGISAGLRVDVIAALLEAGCVPRSIAFPLAQPGWDIIIEIAQNLDQSALPAALVADFCTAFAKGAAFLITRSGDVARLSSSDSSLWVLIRAAYTLAGFQTQSRHLLATDTARMELFVRSFAEELDKSVWRGNFDTTKFCDDSAWVLWLTHLYLGDVTADSWKRFVDWRVEKKMGPRMELTWAHVADRTRPPLSAIAWLSSRPELEEYSSTAVQFGGRAGAIEWARRLSDLFTDLTSAPGKTAQLLLTFGPGVFEQSERLAAEQMLARHFDLETLPFALEALRNQVQLPDYHLRSQDLKLISNWWTGHSRYRSWRRSSFALNALSSVDVAELTTTESMVLLASLGDYMIYSIIVRAAAEGAPDDVLRVLLRYVDPADFADGSTPYFTVESHELRQVVISLVGLADNLEVGSIACLMIQAACRWGTEDSTKIAAVRNSVIDTQLVMLTDSRSPLRRAAGVALFTLRPPRSKADWSRIEWLLESASDAELIDVWGWVIPGAVDVVNDSDRWIPPIMTLLERRPAGAAVRSMSDVLRGLLSNQSQSLSDLAAELNLPA